MFLIVATPERKVKRDLFGGEGRVWRQKRKTREIIPRFQ
jgi:hypothetical protein